MPISNIVKITTNDTKKTYTFTDGQPDQPDTPQLWELEIAGRTFERNGAVNRMKSSSMKEYLVVERQTLVNAGKMPVHNTDDPPPANAPTMEEIILQLLDMVGVRPND